MAADDSFDEFSFPEISPELWAELERAALSTQTLEIVPVTPQAQIDTDSDDNLWADFPEPSSEDWPEPDSPIIPSPEPDRVPLHYLGFAAQDIIDIEDYEDMGKLKSMASLIRPSRAAGSLSVSNIVHPLWSVRSIVMSFMRIKLKWMYRCEYKAKYDLVGLKHQGADQRPAVFEIEKTVIVENKEVIKKVPIHVDKAVAKASEKQAILGSVRGLFLSSEVANVYSGNTPEIGGRTRF
jgi:hypothetical protein